MGATLTGPTAGHVPRLRSAGPRCSTVRTRGGHRLHLGPARGTQHVAEHAVVLRRVVLRRVGPFIRTAAVPATMDTDPREDGVEQRRPRPAPKRGAFCAGAFRAGAFCDAAAWSFVEAHKLSSIRSAPGSPPRASCRRHASSRGGPERRSNRRRFCDNGGDNRPDVSWSRPYALPHRDERRLDPLHRSASISKETNPCGISGLSPFS